jgi:hypothetical protein
MNELHDTVRIGSAYIAFPGRVEFERNNLFRRGFESCRHINQQGPLEIRRPWRNCGLDNPRNSILKPQARLTIS